jgi:hypothetical protein
VKFTLRYIIRKAFTFFAGYQVYDGQEWEMYAVKMYFAVVVAQLRPLLGVMYLVDL